MNVPWLSQTYEGGALIEARGVSKSYPIGKSKLVALDDISLAIAPGEVVAIMGPSGSGKTTLLNCLSGLDGVDSGTVAIAGHELTTLNDRQLTAFRARQMGFVFQTYNLLPVLTGLENVELPLLVSGVRPTEARQRARDAIAQLGLSAWERQKPAELSGGQRQRFTIARALATQPAIVWADEPTGALDSQTSQEIVDVMLQLNRDNQQTFVWVTHAVDIANQAHRLITMRDGRIVEDRPLVARAHAAAANE